MKYKTRGIAAKLAAAAAVSVGSLAMFGVPAAFANGTSAGPATVVDPANPAAPNHLDTGGSLTNWTFRLPPQAHCTKDTATGNYHVSGYIVPIAVDPSTLSFTSAGPTDPTNNPNDFPLVDNSGTPYIFANTAPTSGNVVNIPTLNYAAFSIDGRNATPALPAGSYNVGIGCSGASATNNGDVFWNVVVTMAPSSTDPAGETWTAANPVASIPETSVAILLPLSAVLVLGAAGGIEIRRRRRSGSTPVAAA